MRVVTGDTDLHDTTPYPSVKSNSWNKLEDGTQVYYFSADQKKYNSIKSFLKSEKFDVLYLNSFFSVPFALMPLLAVRLSHIPCKVVVAPRGMMGKGSLSIKPLKKKVFIWLVKKMGLFKQVTWHASTPDERREIEDIFGTNIVVRNAINLTAPRKIEKWQRVKIPGYVNLFCLARISPVKNILAIFRYLRNVNPGYHIHLGLYGTMEDEAYINQCKAFLRTFPDSITVAFNGPIENKKVQEMARNYHFMILPTFNENFGHAIVESFIAGCPVIISNCTPWKNLEQIYAGWDLPLENDAIFTEKINLCARMDQLEYDQWSAGAYALAGKIVNNEDGIKQNKELFL